jgi:hypothetical protein
MRDNVTNMPYLRSMNKARTKLQSRVQMLSNEYQRLLSERNSLIKRGQEYISRAKQSENEALLSQGKQFIVQANDLSRKMESIYQEYQKSEKELEKMQ